jgi:hypothetical protein
MRNAKMGGWGVGEMGRWGDGGWGNGGMGGWHCMTAWDFLWGDGMMGEWGVGKGVIELMFDFVFCLPGFDIFVIGNFFSDPSTLSSVFCLQSADP